MIVNRQVPTGTIDADVLRVMLLHSPIAECESVAVFDGDPNDTVQMMFDAAPSDQDIDDVLAAYPIIYDDFPQAIGQADSPSKGDSQWETIPDMSVQIIPRSQAILAYFSGSFRLAPAGAGLAVSGKIRLAVDGVEVPGSTRTLYLLAANILGLTPAAMNQHPTIPPTRMTGLTPEQMVTVTAEWMVSDGQIVAEGAERLLGATNIV